MTTHSLLWLFFPIAITLHNAEEALWLPEWSRHARPFHKSVERNEFLFAVIIVTVLAYMSTFVTVAAPSVRLGRLIFLGFVGAMLLNVFVPHVAATIFLRQYTPGLATGLALVLPINLTILVNAIASKELSWWELVLSTVVVAGVLLMLLPLFFRLGRLLIKGGLEGRPG